MASATVRLETRIEDALAHLPVTTATEYRKGTMIFGSGRLSKGLYLVVTGKVEISHLSDSGSEVLLDIVLPDELFGESAFVDAQCPSERATALENARVMTWAISDIEHLVIERPRLGVALLQILAQRNLDCNRRIESFSLDTIERRLARSLIRFSDRLGAPEEDGSIHMMPITHAMLSRYIGASREIVSHYMNRFRRLGYVDYSRRGMVLRREVLQTVLD